MHDIWNPWHGCHKKSPGCQNCYMFFLDEQRDKDGSAIFRVKNNFDYPLHKDRSGRYKIKSGEMLRVCMTSDFFIKEADAWRDEAWTIIKKRPDVKFFLLTKRPERVWELLPKDWGDGYENVFFNVSCEDQIRADERIPILHALPFKHRGIMCAPLIGPLSIKKYLKAGKIEQVLCDGENYAGARSLDFEWVKRLKEECEAFNVTFIFCGTGRRFVRDGKLYALKGNSLQVEQAYLSQLSFQGRKINFKLTDSLGLVLDEKDLYRPSFSKTRCDRCSMRLACNGCSNCGACEKKDEKF